MLTRTARRRRSAAAAVELALLLPTVLVPILFGIWEVGRLVQIQQIVENAAREGGRQASTSKYTEDEVKAAVKEYLTSAGLSITDAGGAENVTVTVQMAEPPASGTEPSWGAYDLATMNQNDLVQIEVAYPFVNVRYLASNFFTNEATVLNARSTWSCVKDLPVTVPTTIPQQLLP
jgi:Flp pilus assembly protein TadG